MSIVARSLHGIRVCLIPHAANGYRPLALRHKPLALVSLFLILIKISVFGVLALTPVHAELSTITVNRIVQLTNKKRSAAGLAPLAVNSKLVDAARQKGEHMLEEDYFAHISPDGVTPWFWMSKAGYVYQIAGENLAVDFTEAEDVVAAWMASPTHKENILRSDYTETGIAVVSGEFQGSDSIIVVHMFGAPSQVRAASATQSESPAASVSPTPAIALSPSPTPVPVVVPSPSPTPVPVLLTDLTQPPTPPFMARVISPAFDTALVAIQTPDNSYLITRMDDAAFIVPAFGIDSQIDYLRTPQQLSQLSLRVIAGAAIAILILLGLAIFIRIRIQYPALITHASIVIFLSAILFLL